ncbi:MAG: hypothetical protein Q8N99_04900 [Nanoarchaeota archaeon]|nr:hypothetical protein [Nanoarchaeota archaeon]
MTKHYQQAELAEQTGKTSTFHRRQFLTRLGGIGLVTLVMGGGGYSQDSLHVTNDSNTEKREKMPDSDGYVTLTDINVKVAGTFPILRARFRVTKEKWEALPKGLSKQGLYNKIRDMGIQYEITALVDPENLPRVVGRVVNLYHQGYMNHEDVVDEFLKRAEGFAKSKSPKFDLDPNLKFNKTKKRALVNALSSENLASSETGEISSKLFWTRIVHTYTPRSRIIFESSPKAGSIQVWNNVGENYNKQAPIRITSQSEIEALHSFFMFSILSTDPALKDYPVNKMYEVYTTGRTLEGNFSLSEKEAKSYRE